MQPCISSGWTKTKAGLSLEHTTAMHKQWEARTAQKWIFSKATQLPTRSPPMAALMNVPLTQIISNASTAKTTTSAITVDVA